MAFLVPIAFFFGLIEFSLLWTGDAWPAAAVLRLQRRSAEELIYERGRFSQQFNVYKLSGIRALRPRILAVGSSRMMQLRDFMFTPLEGDFYNAGGLLQNEADLDALSRMIGGGDLPVPEVIIAGIDPWWISTRWSSQSWLGEQDDVLSLATHVAVIREMVEEGLLKSFAAAFALPRRPPPFRHLAAGSSARLNGSGFRRDGSYLYGPYIESFISNPVYVDRESPPLARRIRRGLVQFGTAMELDRGKVSVIVESLGRLQDAGAEVLVFLPPFAGGTMRILDGKPEYRAWWSYYREDFPRLLESRGIRVIAAGAPAGRGLDDRYMVDGMHPGEVYMAHVVVEMARTGPPGSLLSGIDLPALTARIESAALPVSFSLPPPALHAGGAE